VTGIAQGAEGEHDDRQPLEPERYIGQQLLDDHEGNPTGNRTFHCGYAGCEHDDDEHQGELIIEQRRIGILRVDYQQGSAYASDGAGKSEDHHALPGQMMPRPAAAVSLPRMAPRYWPTVPIRTRRTMKTANTRTTKARTKNW